MAAVGPDPLFTLSVAAAAAGGVAVLAALHWKTPASARISAAFATVTTAACVATLGDALPTLGLRWDWLPAATAALQAAAAALALALLPPRRPAPPPPPVEAVAESPLAGLGRRYAEGVRRIDADVRRVDQALARVEAAARACTELY